MKLTPPTLLRDLLAAGVSPSKGRNDFIASVRPPSGVHHPRQPGNSSVDQTSDRVLANDSLPESVGLVSDLRKLI